MKSTGRQEAGAARIALGPQATEAGRTRFGGTDGLPPHARASQSTKRRLPPAVVVRSAQPNLAARVGNHHRGHSATVRTVPAVGGATRRDSERLLPRSLRRSAFALSAACAVVLTALAVRYNGGDRPGTFDEWVYSRLTRLRLPRGPLTSVVDAVPPTFVVLVAVLTVVLAAQRRWRPAALATLGPALALLVTEVGKRVVGRSLDGGFALPSGHTTGVASVVATMAILRLGHATHVRRAAATGLLTATLAAGAIGILMVTLHFHYATDIFAGYCVALAVPLAVALAIDGMPHQDRRERKAFSAAESARRGPNGSPRPRTRARTRG
jgi:membrane-associated phospholipid phosphatase